MCRHVLCRHTNTGHFRYRGATEPFDGEWRGQSHTPDFTVFGAGCRYTYSDQTRVLGGHGLLIVAVRLPGATLCDYVHLRIAGTNPIAVRRLRVSRCPPRRTRRQRRAHGPRDLSARVGLHTVCRPGAAIGGDDLYQTPSCRRHTAGLSCPLRLAGRSSGLPAGELRLRRRDLAVHACRGQTISAELAWDWRENIRRGTNLFLGKLRRKVQPDITWKHLALAAWAAYNGSGEAAERYAQRLALSEEGARVSLDRASAAPHLALIDARARARPAG